MTDDMSEDTALLDWLEAAEDSLMCWNVGGEKNNGWSVGTGDDPPQGKTVRDALRWAKKLHEQGKFKTRSDRERDGEPEEGA